jgi:hypothetical protein
MTDVVENVTIENMNIAVDDTIEIDPNAPEPGSFPPRLKPGIYDFLFKLEETEPFGVTGWEKDGKKFVEVRHRAIITRTLEDGSQEDVELRFIRATNFLNPAMRKAKMQSTITNLIRSLGIKLEGQVPWSVIQDELKAADGRAYGRLALGWRARFPGTESIVSTAARAKRGETAWVKDKNGDYEPMAKDPKSTATAYGRENVLNYLLRDNTTFDHNVNHDEPSDTFPTA